jgi:hypothetical protein
VTVEAYEALQEQLREREAELDQLHKTIRELHRTIRWNAVAGGGRLL